MKTVTHDAAKKPVMPPWKAPGGLPCGKYAYSPRPESWAGAGVANIAGLICAAAFMALCMILALRLFGG